jgi:hypothetical protein
MDYLEQKLGRDVFGLVLEFCDPVAEKQKHAKKIIDLLFKYQLTFCYSRQLKIHYASDLFKLYWDRKRFPKATVYLCGCNGYSMYCYNEIYGIGKDKELGLRRFKEHSIKNKASDADIPDWFMKEIFGKHIREKWN